MRIATPPKREMGESIVPMINVVFLLLIFFLMTAQITPPAPFEVAPPRGGTGAELARAPTLHVAADGQVGFEDLVGDAALDAVAAARAAAGPLPVRADAGLEATALAALMRRLAERGVPQVEIVVAAR